MKILIAAIALTVAFPAIGQQAEHKGHADHAPHQGMDHGKEHKDCCDHKNKDGTPMKCCAEAMKSGKKMDCCDKSKDHAAHQGMKH